MGKQSMYHVSITVDVGGYGESDSWSQLFGFRKIESYIDKKTGGRYLLISNWIHNLICYVSLSFFCHYL